MKRSAIALLAVLLGASPVLAASRYLPSLRFRVLATPHFLIYFHQSEDATARRFALIAEQVHAELTGRLRVTFLERTHVILVDQHDTAGGWASPLPYDTIEISVAPPTPDEFLGNTDDWLRLVFVHEYTHILQQDRSAGVARVARAVFGRSPLAFANMALPTWQIEGLATFEESAVTGRGRVHAGDFARLVDQAALARQPLTLSRASSDFDPWPSGEAPYAYGAFFYQFLANRFGEDRVAALQSRTAGQFYFAGSRAFKGVFGESLGDLWKAFLAARAEHARADAPRGRRLTSQGYTVTDPRFVTMPSGRTEIVYSLRDADDFPSLMAVTLEARTRRLAWRSAGAHASAASGAVVFDELDLAESVALRSDLSLLDLKSGRVSRLTRDARFVEPAVSPRGDRLACIVVGDGARRLVVFDLPVGAWPGDLGRLRRTLAQPPRLTLGDAGTDYASPRWSPDGRTLAVSRVLRGGPSQIVVADASSGQVRPVVSGRGVRLVTPAWTHEGTTLLFAADRGDEPFNIFAVELDVAGATTGRSRALFQVTDFASGASSPDVSPDDRSIAYVGYTSAGYDVFLLPLDRTAWRAAEPFDADAGGDGAVASAPAKPSDGAVAASRTSDGVTTTPYHPWATLTPRYWLPAFELSNEQLKLGVQTSGNDVLGRHTWAATALARVAGKAGAPGSTRYDWAASYTYDRWRPAIWVAASDETHFQADVFITADTLAPADIRDQDVQVGVTLPDAHLRWAQSWSASFDAQRRTRRVGPESATRDRNGVRLAWQFNSAKVYPLSISPEQGVRAGVGAEIVRSALGADGNAAALTADARGYLRLGGRHAVLAARVGVGVSGGSGPTTEFQLGGPGPNAALVDFGGDGLSLLRGQAPEFAFFGSHALVANLEYRLPVLRVDRGLGTLPVFLRVLHATAFLDLGKTWTDDFSRRGFARGAGFEAGADVRIAYQVPLTLMVGVAWPHDPFRPRASLPPVAYLRIGRAF